MEQRKLKRRFRCGGIVLGSKTGQFRHGRWLLLYTWANVKRSILRPREQPGSERLALLPTWQTCLHNKNGRQHMPTAVLNVLRSQAPIANSGSGRGARQNPDLTCARHRVRRRRENLHHGSCRHGSLHPESSYLGNFRRGSLRLESSGLERFRRGSSRSARVLHKRSRD